MEDSPDHLVGCFRMSQGVFVGIRGRGLVFLREFLSRICQLAKVKPPKSIVTCQTKAKKKVLSVVPSMTQSVKAKSSHEI